MEIVAIYSVKRTLPNIFLNLTDLCDFMQATLWYQYLYQYSNYNRYLSRFEMHIKLSFKHYFQAVQSHLIALPS